MFTFSYCPCLGRMFICSLSFPVLLQPLLPTSEFSFLFSVLILSLETVTAFRDASLTVFKYHLNLFLFPRKVPPCTHSSQI